MTRLLAVLGLISAGNVLAADAKHYQPTWESIDSRPTPAWWSDAKFGIFIHWGVYSVPSFAPKGEYAEWYWERLGRPGDADPASKDAALVRRDGSDLERALSEARAELLPGYLPRIVLLSDGRETSGDARAAVSATTAASAAKATIFACAGRTDVCSASIFAAASLMPLLEMLCETSTR